MAESTPVRRHLRRGRPVREHMRIIEAPPYHPDLNESGDETRKRGGLRDDMFQKVATGEVDYMANGPWEVVREKNGDVVLYHYKHPLARAKNGNLTAQAREGYGFSATDMRGVRDMAGVLGLQTPEMHQTAFTPYTLNGMGNRVGVGLDAEGKLRRYDPFTSELIIPKNYPEGDWRRRERVGPSRMSPYAILDRDLAGGEHEPRTYYFPSRRYPNRRSQRTEQ